jgi:hypothetical protein
MSFGQPYPLGFRVVAEAPPGDVTAATVVACERVGTTETWTVTREHDRGGRVTTVWPADRLRPLSDLTEAQRDGRACLSCGSDDGAMRPVGRINDCQVFAHGRCRGGGER